MNTKRDTYQQELLLALREHDIPGRRIAEALAEVDSHVAETDDDPRDAFGDPKEYADRLAEALDSRPQRGWFWLLHWTWQDGLIVVVTLAGTGLLVPGLYGLGAGERGALGMPAIVSTLAGLAVLAAVFVRTVINVRRLADRVVDPRTGKEMAPRVPRWVMPVMLAPICVMLLVVYLLGRFA